MYYLSTTHVSRSASLSPDLLYDGGCKDTLDSFVAITHPFGFGLISYESPLLVCFVRIHMQLACPEIWAMWSSLPFAPRSFRVPIAAGRWVPR